MATLPSLGTPNARLAEALKQLSAAKFGRPKAIVDQEINRRMETRAPVRPASGQGGQGMAPGAASRPAAGNAARPSGTSGSFLDDWLNKRKAGGAGAPAASGGPQPGAPASPSADTATIRPVGPPADAAKNISSDELARGEVNKIAAELKHELNAPKAKAGSKSKTEDTIELKPGKDDTIFIDQDGSFRVNQNDA